WRNIHQQPFTVGGRTARGPPRRWPKPLRPHKALGRGAGWAHACNTSARPCDDRPARNVEEAPHEDSPDRRSWCPARPRRRRGPAQLTVSRDDGFQTSESEAQEGGALMGAVGYEVMSARNFAIDLQLRATGGAYKDSSVELDGSTHDSKVGTTSLNLGFNWY